MINVFCKWMHSEQWFKSIKCFRGGNWRLRKVLLPSVLPCFFICVCVCGGLHTTVSVPDSIVCSIFTSHPPVSQRNPYICCFGFILCGSNFWNSIFFFHTLIYKVPRILTVSLWSLFSLNLVFDICYPQSLVISCLMLVCVCLAFETHEAKTGLELLTIGFPDLSHHTSWVLFLRVSFPAL